MNIFRKVYSNFINRSKVVSKHAKDHIFHFQAHVKIPMAYQKKFWFSQVVILNMVLYLALNNDWAFHRCQNRVWFYLQYYLWHRRRSFILLSFV